MWRCTILFSTNFHQISLQKRRRFQHSEHVNSRKLCKPVCLLKLSCKAPTSNLQLLPYHHLQTVCRSAYKLKITVKYLLWHQLINSLVLVFPSNRYLHFWLLCLLCTIFIQQHVNAPFLKNKHHPFRSRAVWYFHILSSRVSHILVFCKYFPRYGHLKIRSLWDLHFYFGQCVRLAVKWEI